MQSKLFCKKRTLLPLRREATYLFRTSKQASSTLLLKQTSPISPCSSFKKCYPAIINQQKRIIQTSSTDSQASPSAPPSPAAPSNIFIELSQRYPKTKPYIELMRLEKPIGTYLLLWPCLWSLAFAQPYLVGCGMAMQFLHAAKLATCFSVGALVMRGAGCTVNDLWDRDIDKQVERTRTRPLASGAITPARAVAFLGGQLLVGFLVVLNLNLYSILVASASLGLVTIYPLMKRLTYWPQFVLGLTFNWGALVGYASVVGANALMNWSMVLPLYAAGVCWTLVYDTIYAHQDKVDDKKVGVKSTALRFGENTKAWLTLFAVGFAVCLVFAGLNENFTSFTKHWPYFASVAACFIHLLHQIHTVNYNSPQQCMQKFISNKWVGLILFLGIIASNLIVMLDKEEYKTKIQPKKDAVAVANPPKSIVGRFQDVLQFLGLQEKSKTTVKA